MKSRVRYYAVLILKEVLEEGRWANKLLVYYSFRVKPESVPLLSALVNGTVKYKLFTDWVLEKYLGKKKFAKLTPWIRTILRMGVFQLYFLENVPEYAVVNESVELAKRFGHRGTAGLVNAVLKRVARERIYPDEVWIRYSHPEWLYKKLVEIFGDDKAVQVMEHNNLPARTFLRVNTLRASREKFESMLTEFERFEFPPFAYRVDKLPHLLGIPEEYYYVQDLSSQTVPHLLAPEPGDLVLDMTGAPGGKITYAYQLEPTINAVSVEIHLSRAKEIKRLSGRLGTKIYVVNGDSTYIGFKRKFDKILLDAPCSGLGTLRRHAELRWRMSQERINELVKLQKRLMENAATLVKDGGVIVYSTCTITKEENEGIIEWFLAKHPDFELEGAADFIPSEFTRGKFLFVDGTLHDSDFSFAARLRKVG